MDQTRPINSKTPNGVAIAAYISAMIGLLVLSLCAVIAEMSIPFKEWVQGVGQLWMPGAEGIGPYSGKESLSLLAWLITWVILHRMLGKRELNGNFWLTIFLFGIGIATTLIWPPVWHFLSV